MVTPQKVWQIHGTLMIKVEAKRNMIIRSTLHPVLVVPLNFQHLCIHYSIHWLQNRYGREDQRRASVSILLSVIVQTCLATNHLFRVDIRPVGTTIPETKALTIGNNKYSRLFAGVL